MVKYSGEVGLRILLATVRESYDTSCLSLIDEKLIFRTIILNNVNEVLTLQRYETVHLTHHFLKAILDFNQLLDAFVVQYYGGIRKYMEQESTELMKEFVIRWSKALCVLIAHGIAKLNDAGLNNALLVHVGTIFQRELFRLKHCVETGSYDKYDLMFPTKCDNWLKKGTYENTFNYSEY